MKHTPGDISPVWDPSPMAIHPIRPGAFFSPRTDLPRGRHALGREEAIEAQRERLMAAFTELVAEHGLAGVTVGNVVAHAGVSRAAFYSCFEDLAGCGDAAYERFISVLLERLAGAMNPTDHWQIFIESSVRAYLEELQADPVVARAMQIEMDAAGKAARVRRRHALRLIADVIASRHALLREENPAIAPAPDEVHLGFVYAIRQLACDALDDSPDPDLLRLVEPTVEWITATVNGAATVEGGAPASDRVP